MNLRSRLTRMERKIDPGKAYYWRVCIEQPDGAFVETSSGEIEKGAEDLHIMVMRSFNGTTPSLSTCPAGRGFERK